MNHPTLFAHPRGVARSAALLLVGLAGAASAMSASVTEDPAYSTYRRAVLGDETAGAPAAQLATARLQPGPYAGHLIYLGVDARSAIEQARAVGEQPVLQPAMAKPAHETGLAAYERVVLGHSTAIGSEGTTVR